MVIIWVPNPLYIYSCNAVMYTSVPFMEVNGNKIYL